MNDIDFIKWMGERADGFEFIRKEDDGDYYIGYSKYSGDYFDINDYERFIHPLILQRTIEKLTIEKIHVIIDNRKNGMYSWRIYSYECKYLNDYDLYEMYETIDECKEAALKYIYEQEDK